MPEGPNPGQVSECWTRLFGVAPTKVDTGSHFECGQIQTSVDPSDSSWDYAQADLIIPVYLEHLGCAIGR